MTSTERSKLLNTIYEDQNNLADELNIRLSNIIDYDEFSKIGIEIPSISIVDSNLISLSLIQDINEIDETVFAKWKIADIPMMFAAGILGTFTSTMLKETFNKYHQKMGKTSTLDGGHGGESIDRVPGSKQSGGFGHRTKYGHDLFNPFEIDWSDYLEKAKQSKIPLPPWLKAYFYWVRHLLQDTFSTEGLPLPGHSLIRKYIDPVKNRELLQIFNTIKMRDVAGAGITNVIMGAYLWGTEKSIKRVTIQPNYRAFSLMLGANCINLLAGLYQPTKIATFNWSTIPIIGYYGFQLIKLEKQVRETLNKRDIQLNENLRVLEKNDTLLQQFTIFDDQTYNELLKYEDELFKYNDEVLKYHSYIKESIIMED